MNAPTLAHLEDALLARNPLMEKLLQPGLSEIKVRRSLSRHHISGEVEAIVRIYSWKNGTWLTDGVTIADGAFFPGSIYHFLELQSAIAHLKGLEEMASYYPQLAEGVNRYFPIFWDGETGWLSLDMKPGSENRVILVQFESDEPFREVYASFEKFLSDAITANREDEPLSCL